MQESEGGEPETLDYGNAPPKSNWPVGLYLGMVAWAFVTMSIFTASLDGPEKNAARGQGQVALLTCALLRLSWAMHRKEKSKGWIFYVALLFLAAPIWMLVEQPLWSLGHELWGHGLNR